MSDLTFQIVKSFGTIGDERDGWQKEINLVSWNERKPKLDIREWAEEHSKMKKGITFNINETKALKEILSNLDMAQIEAEV